MVHQALILQLEQQILDAHADNSRLKDLVQNHFNAQTTLTIGSDEYNRHSSDIHALFRTIEDNHLKIARFYRRLEKMEIKQHA